MLDTKKQHRDIPQKIAMEHDFDCVTHWVIDYPPPRRVYDITNSNAKSRDALGVKVGEGYVSLDYFAGFLVGPDLLMTAAYCTDTYAGTIAVFNFENGVDPSQLEAFRCDTLVRRDILIDAALLRCQAGPIGSSSPVLPGNHRGRGFIDLEDYSELQDGDDIYVINQNCVDGGLTTPPFTNRTCVPTKKLSRGDLLNYYCPNPGTKLGRGYFFDLFHNADTLPGSSGSPIFSATTHKIVGIHKCCTPRRYDGTIIDGRAPSSGNEGTRAKQLLDFANSINLRLVDIFLIVLLTCPAVFGMI